MQLIKVSRGEAVVDIQTSELQRLSYILSAVIEQYEDIDPAILKLELNEVIELHNHIRVFLTAIDSYEGKNI